MEIGAWVLCVREMDCCLPLPESISYTTTHVLCINISPTMTTTTAHLSISHPHHLLLPSSFTISLPPPPSQCTHTHWVFLSPTLPDKNWVFSLLSFLSFLAYSTVDSISISWGFGLVWLRTVPNLHFSLSLCLCVIFCAPLLLLLALTYLLCQARHTILSLPPSRQLPQFVRLSFFPPGKRRGGLRQGALGALPPPLFSSLYSYVRAMSPPISRLHSAKHHLRPQNACNYHHVFIHQSKFEKSSLTLKEEVSFHDQHPFVHEAKYFSV